MIATHLPQDGPPWRVYTQISGMCLTLGALLSLTSFARSQTVAAELAPWAQQPLRRADLPGDAASLLQFFRQRTPSSAKMDELVLQVRQLGAVAYKARQKALAQLVHAGHRARPLLREALTDPDPEIARRAAVALQRTATDPDGPNVAAAARRLALLKPREATAVLLEYLPIAENAVADEVRDALADLAVHEGHPAPGLVQALQDPLPSKRAAAGQALARAGGATAKTALSLLQDPQPSVRFEVGMAMAHVGEKGAIPVLVDLLDKVPAGRRLEVLGVLQCLAGDQCPDAKSSSLSPAKVRQLWQAWWEKHAVTVEMARLQQPGPLHGYTLITLFGLHGSMGEVLEIDAAQKTRWRITGLYFPVDAQVVGKDRVLIAEYLGQRVTERDFEGTIHWEMQVSAPIGCQRLVNGNVFIVTGCQLLEVDRAGNEVFRHFEHDEVILAARKLPNAQMLLITGNGTCKCLDPTGMELGRFRIGPVDVIGVNIDVLSGGRLLVPECRGNRVVEYNRHGNKVWQADVPQPTSAVYLPGGHVLVASQRGVVELDRQGRQMWHLAAEGLQWCARRR